MVRFNSREEYERWRKQREAGPVPKTAGEQTSAPETVSLPDENVPEVAEKRLSFFQSHRRLVQVLGGIFVLVVTGTVIGAIYRSSTMAKLLEEAEAFDANLSVETKDELEASIVQLKRLIESATAMADHSSWSKEEVWTIVETVMDRTEAFSKALNSIEESTNTLHGIERSDIYSLFCCGTKLVVAAIDDEQARRLVMIRLTSTGMSLSCSVKNYVSSEYGAQVEQVRKTRGPSYQETMEERINRGRTRVNTQEATNEAIRRTYHPDRQ